MAEIDPTAAASGAEDRSPSLAQYVGEMYGDYSDSGREDEPEPSPEAPSGAAPDPSVGSSEGDAPVDAAGAPPAEPTDPRAEPDTPHEPASPEPDGVDALLDGASPLDYQVDGQGRTFDGITVLKSGGAIIDAEALDKVRQRLSERDHLYEKAQTDGRRYQDLEKLTAWQTRDQNGQVQTLTGARGLEAQRVGMARLAAEQITLREFLKDPAKVAGLLTQDEQGNIALYRPGFDTLSALLENASMKAEMQTRTAFSQMAQPTPAPAPGPETFAKATIAQLVQQQQIQGLTQKDVEFLEAEFPRYVVKENGRDALHPRFLEIMKDRAELRSGQARAAQAASEAQRNNAGRLAAAQAGKAVTAKPRAPQPRGPAAQPAPEPVDPKAEAWDRMQRASASVMREKSGALGALRH